MEFVHVAVAVLSLLSVGQSAPVTDCESLTQQIEIQGRDQLLGKWMYIADSTDLPGNKMLIKKFVESVWGNLTAASQSDTITAHTYQKMLGLCFTYSHNMTFGNNTLAMVKPYPGSAVLLSTGCPDCLVISANATIGSTTYRNVQLLSRRNKVSAAQLEEFTKQAECLNLPPPAVLDAEKEFCPEASSETKTIDLTDTMNNMSPDDFKLFDKIFRSESGMKSFMHLVSSTLEQLKGN